MKTPGIPIALEGYPFIFFCAFTTLLLALLEITWAAIPGLIVTGFVTWFFRDPERVTPDSSDFFVAPADGRIIAVEQTTDERFGPDHVHKVSIFMNIFDVHVNRFPFSGRIEQVQFKPGKFYSADSPRGALQNEYCALTVQTGSDLRYGVVQVAGLIARRIVCWAEKGDSLQTGQRFGLIRFGSRVDLYLPLQVKLEVKTGDKVKAGETILGHLTGSA